MPKRKANDTVEHLPPLKRQRLTTSDHLSHLSDELQLRIFSHLPIHDLATCHRVSRRTQTIAGDSQLWRTAYYDRFVRPRFNKLPKARRSPHPSKLARWLDESFLVERGRTINWKRQYKLRHKWSQGICEVSEIPVATRPPVPPLLARLHEGIVYAVDSFAGLRAWSYKGKQELLASHDLATSPPSASRQPTSFVIDTEAQLRGCQRMMVGFEDGAFSIYSYNRQQYCFMHIYTHPSSTNHRLTAVALASPYILSMSETQTLSLYRLGSSIEDFPVNGIRDPPRLLSSLKSHTVWPPLSLSLRVSGSRIIAAIAYSMPTFNSGWSAGVQELHISSNGEIIDSRIASASGHGFSIARHPDTSPVLSKPTSLSYSHPYMLVSHADNTLTLYMVNSTDSKLFVSPGKRLWGHTSSVFGAHVGGRGKAVSVSTRGNEVRVWELEGSTLAKSDAEVVGESNLSVQVTPEKWQPRLQTTQISRTMAARSGSFCALDERYSIKPDITRGWVGFDDEDVVVLREHDHGHQTLAVYDFS